MLSSVVTCISHIYHSLFQMIDENSLDFKLCLMSIISNRQFSLLLNTIEILFISQVPNILKGGRGIQPILLR